MKILVDRFDPEAGKQWCKEYEVDLQGKNMTVQDVLEEIAQNQDTTLGFYRHSVCNHGICAGCMLCVNGRPRLACTELVNQYKELHLSPLAGREIARDLVVKPR